MIASYYQIRGVFTTASQALGPMLKYLDSRGEAMLSMTGNHSMVSAQYITAGSFEKGNA